MTKNINEILDSLSPERRKRVEDRAAQLAAQEGAAQALDDALPWFPYHQLSEEELAALRGKAKE